MNLRHIALSVLLAMMFVSGFSLAEDAGQENVTAEEPVGVTIDVVEEVVEETSIVVDETDDSSVAEFANLEGNWVFNLDQSQIGMVVYQFGEDLFGAAKSEDSNPWNALMTGSLSGDEVEFDLMYVQKAEMITIEIRGTVSDGMVNGNFVKATSLGEVIDGEVMGFLTIPDTSGYEPAEVASEPATTLAPVVKEESIAAPVQTSSDEGKSRFVDVTDYRDMIAPVGVIPVGMA